MTFEEAQLLFAAALSGGRRDSDAAEQICAVWNREKSRIGGVFGNGFFVRDGRVIRKPYDWSKELGASA